MNAHIFALNLGVGLGLALLAVRPAMAGPLPAEERDRIHHLATHHQDIRRTVKETETGYIATLVCKDPALLQELKAHIQAMGERLDGGLPVRMWDPAFQEFVRQYPDIEHRMEETRKGFRMVVNGKTPAAIEAARLHARVVSDFVAHGPEGVQRVHDAAWAGGEPDAEAKANRQAVGSEEAPEPVRGACGQGCAGCGRPGNPGAEPACQAGNRRGPPEARGPRRFRGGRGDPDPSPPASTSDPALNQP